MLGLLIVATCLPEVSGKVITSPDVRPANVTSGCSLNGATVRSLSAYAARASSMYGSR